MFFQIKTMAGPQHYLGSWTHSVERRTIGRRNRPFLKSMGHTDEIMMNTRTFYAPLTRYNLIFIISDFICGLWVWFTTVLIDNRNVHILIFLPENLVPRVLMWRVILTEFTVLTAYLSFPAIFFKLEKYGYLRNLW